MFTKAQNNVTILLFSLLLLSYAGILIANNYRSQIALQKVTLFQMKQGLEKQALTLGYFFSERENDLENITKSRAISAYYENLALGMTFEYGLQFSLNNISREFADFVEEKQVGGKSIYRRIVLINKEGALLAVSDPGSKIAERDLTRFQFHNTAGTLFFEDFHQDHWDIVVSVPYFFKENYSGQILAWINPQILFEYFLSSASKTSDHLTALVFRQDFLLLEKASPRWASSFIEHHIKKFQADYFQNFEVVDDLGEKKKILVIKIPIKSTPFSLINILPPSAVVGQKSPSTLLIAMGLFTLVVLGVTFILWRANSKNLVLQTRIVEANKRKLEIEAKNVQLSREIAERKKAEEQTNQLANQLLHAQKMEAVGTLAGGIAHDFNNILSAIIGFTELAQINIKNPEQAVTDLQEVAKAGHRAKELVKQILTFSRKEDHDVEPLSPHLIIKESLKLLRASIPTSIEIQEDIDPASGTILADPTKIHQIILNLCTNALHAMENEQGTLKVMLRRKVLSAKDLENEHNVSPGPFVELTVSDTGCGIAPGTLGRIFEPFFTTKEVGKGTGMGLAVVHGIVKDYHGLINIDSEQGKGTAFRIYFPAISIQVEETRNERLDSLPKGSEHILLVDDESTIVRMLKAALEQQGYQVTGTTSSVEALEKFREHPDSFDLMISDQTMPQMSGSELVKEILAIKPSFPIILCTGYSSIVSEEDAKKMGVRAYALKPIEISQLAHLVRQVLSESESQGLQASVQ